MSTRFTVSRVYWRKEGEDPKRSTLFGLFTLSGTFANLIADVAGY